MASEQPHINNPLPQDAEAPIPIELLQSLPTTSAPSIPETWQQVLDTDVPASKSPVSNWLWPIIIILSAVTAGLVNFVFTDIAIRPVIVFWFLIVCPGMVLVRFFRLKEPVVEWTLALALSFAIDALVAGIQLYAGKWSPTGTLGILIGLSLGGTIAQLPTMGFISTAILKPLHILHSRKLRVLSANLLAWVERFWGAQWAPRRLQSLMSRNAQLVPSRQPDTSKPESSVTQPATVAVPSHQLHAPRARKRGALWHFAWKHTVEKPATVAVPKGWRVPSVWKLGIVLIFLVLLIGVGVVAFVARRYAADIRTVLLLHFLPLC